MLVGSCVPSGFCLCVGSAILVLYCLTGKTADHPAKSVHTGVAPGGGGQLDLRFRSGEGLLGVDQYLGRIGVAASPFASVL